MDKGLIEPWVITVLLGEGNAYLTLNDTQRNAFRLAEWLAKGSEHSVVLTYPHGIRVSCTPDGTWNGPL